jgi:putative endonuclease
VFPQSKPAPLRTTKQRGDAAEDEALRYLERQGLRLITRNYRTPGRVGGEIDLIMQAHDGTHVFVEVRTLMNTEHGRAAACVSHTKQRRIIFAARHYLLGLRVVPPCRFDVVVLEPLGIEWLQAAFDAA